MRATRAWLAGTLLLLGGCVGLAPEAQDIDAKRFEPLPDKGVIYLVRGEPLYSDRPVPVWLGNPLLITTYPDTFFLWEVPPGALLWGRGPREGAFRGWAGLCPDRGAGGWEGRGWRRRGGRAGSGPGGAGGGEP